MFCSGIAHAQGRRYVIADQDAMGPGGSDMRSLMVFLQSPDVDLLGITVVTGDGWRDEEVAHTLRLLEILGRTDIRVYPGANNPLWRTREWTLQAERIYGKAAWLGAWREGHTDYALDALPALEEGRPTSKPASEDAAHFMVRMVHEHPHQVTIYGAGPLTNIAVAITIDRHFAELAKELVIMGGSIRPQTEEKEWTNAPRHEFNFWFDPEAASITLRAPWAKISQTTIDASIQTRLAPEITDAVSKSNSIAAQYMRRYIHLPVEGVSQFIWDELAAATWLDPLITKSEKFVYEDVSTDHGANYGDTLTWSDADKPALTLPKVHVQMEADLPRLQELLIRLFSSPTPQARSAGVPQEGD
jgi:purine nucleosidase